MLTSPLNKTILLKPLVNRANGLLHLLPHYKYASISGILTIAPWLLTTGFWDDSGAWDDSATWLELFTPSDLFAAGEQGVWYDPSDMSTMFQDAAGTTPVTAVGQRVGLVLDKSKGLVLGPEVVVNGAFTGNSSAGWNLVSGATVSNEKLNLNTPVSNVISTYALETGKSYKWSITISDYVSGTVNLNFGGTTQVQATANGTYTGIAVRVTSTVGPRFLFTGSPIASIDNISIRELPGNHAFQATSIARPLYQSPPARIVRDGIDDVLNTTFPVSLGSNCTVARAIPGVGAQILTSQTIGTSFADTVTSCNTVIINRALTGPETAALTTYLNGKAGV